MKVNLINKELREDCRTGSTDKTDSYQQTITSQTREKEDDLLV